MSDQQRLGPAPVMAQEIHWYSSGTVWHVHMSSHREGQPVGEWETYAVDVEQQDLWEAVFTMLGQLQGMHPPRRR